MTTRIVTKEDLIEAAERNGYKQSKSGWFNYENTFPSGAGYGTKDNPIVEACFMGQIAINLGVRFGELQYLLDAEFKGLGHSIIGWNDGQNLNYNTILKRFLTKVSNTPFKSKRVEKAKYYAKRKDEL